MFENFLTFYIHYPSAITGFVVGVITIFVIACIFGGGGEN